MASIIAENISLIFPFIGSDSKFGSRLNKKKRVHKEQIGGQIITGQGRKNGIKAIDNFSIHLKHGDRLGIFGHNGAGKSTLLKVLAGIYPPTSGRLSINGKVTGMFSLSLGINKEISGLENIILKGMMYGMRKREIKALVPEIVAFSELGDFIHMPVKTYSSGMSLRLQFSIASALKPDILLMDEWISSADETFKAKMDKRLNEMVEKAPIVIIASHSESRLYSWANQVIKMKNGQVISTENTKTYKAPKELAFKVDPELVKKYSLLLNLGKTEEAFKFIGTVWPEAKDPLGYHSRRAPYFLKTNQFVAGVEAYKNLLELAPNNLKFMDQLGRLYYKNKDFNEAAQYLTQAIKRSSGTIGSIPTLKLAHENLGTPEVFAEVMAQIVGGT